MDQKMTRATSSQGYGDKMLVTSGMWMITTVEEPTPEEKSSETSWQNILSVSKKPSHSKKEGFVSSYIKARVLFRANHIFREQITSLFELCIICFDCQFELYGDLCFTELCDNNAIYFRVCCGHHSSNVHLAVHEPPEDCHSKLGIDVEHPWRHS